MLLNGDLDHTLGLLSLREWSRLDIYATAAVADAFTRGNVLNQALCRYENHSVWHRIEPDVPLELAGGLQIEPIAVPGKPPIYLVDASRTDCRWNLGLRIAHRGRVLGYFPGVGAIDDALRAALRGLDALFFDGTLWSDGELIELGLAQVRGRDMAHLPVSETLDALRDVEVARRWFIHINNTNPILREDSAEAGRVRAAGWQLAEDGQELDL